MAAEDTFLRIQNLFLWVATHNYNLQLSCISIENVAKKFAICDSNMAGCGILKANPHSVFCSCGSCNSRHYYCWICRICGHITIFTLATLLHWTLRHFRETKTEIIAKRKFKGWLQLMKATPWRKWGTTKEQTMGGGGSLPPLCCGG